MIPRGKSAQSGSIGKAKQHKKRSRVRIGKKGGFWDPEDNKKQDQ